MGFFLCFNCRPTGYGMAPLVPRPECLEGEHRDAHGEMQARKQNADVPWNIYRGESARLIMLRTHCDEGDTHER